MSVAVVFETHSTSIDNEFGIATGWNEGELSETGREQARQLGERRRDDGIDVVFTSDLRRAVETAEIAFAGSAELPSRLPENSRVSALAATFQSRFQLFSSFFIKNARHPAIPANSANIIFS
jgi:broad specificity phosphatase PhoE